MYNNASFYSFEMTRGKKSTKAITPQPPPADSTHLSVQPRKNVRSNRKATRADEAPQFHRCAIDGFPLMATPTPITTTKTANELFIIVWGNTLAGRAEKEMDRKCRNVVGQTTNGRTRIYRRFIGFRRVRPNVLLPSVRPSIHP